MNQNPPARCPVLVVDLGETLLRRTRPGAVQRLLDELVCIGVQVPLGDGQFAFARAVLTSRTPDAALAQLTKLVPLDRRQQTRLRDVLLQPEGDAVLIEGSLELLSTARSLGWRIVAATNATGWVAPLPTELEHSLESVVSSSSLGAAKQELEFWQQFIICVGNEPQRTLVIGDSFDADVRPAQRCGLAALHVDHDEVTLRKVSTALADLGPPPEPCNGLLAGCWEVWGGSKVVDAAHLRDLLVDVTRASATLHFGSSKLRGQLVRRREEPPAFALPKRVAAPPLLSWLRIDPDRRATVVPHDLRHAMDASGVTLKDLTPAEQRHLTSMVREALDQSLRAERISHVVSYLLSRRNYHR